MHGVNNISSQLWDSRSTRFLRNLVLGSVVFLGLACGVSWGADQANKLIAVTMDTDAAIPTVTVQTAEPVGYRYTVYDSFEPIRVVIDFPGMEVSDIAASTPVNKGVVQEIRTVGFALSSGKLARVEILLTKAAEYQVSLDGKNFNVTFTGDNNPSGKKASKVAPTVPSPSVPVAVDASADAKVLSNVSLSAGRAILATNGKIGKLNYFALKNPPRLVVDVYNVKPGFKERSFPAEAGFKTVRVGIYNDKTRLVFDASDNTLPEHRVEGRSTDILVSWGDAKSAGIDKPQKATKPATTTATAKPVKTAATSPNNTEAKAVDSASVVPVRVNAPTSVEAIDFSNKDGRSIIAVALSAVSTVTGPVKDGNLLRFEIVNSSISRALRRTIDASAFPGAVLSVTPYIISDGNHQNVRVAVDLKGPVAYSLEQDGSMVRLVVDDGAYAEPVSPAFSQVDVVVPEKQRSDVASAGVKAFTPTRTPVTASEMNTEANRYTGEKITLVFDSANVRSILQLIGEVSGLNILASSDVQGSVTLRLIDVPWDQALELVLETASLGKIQQGNVLRIMPKDKIKEIEQTAMKEQTVAIEEGVLETKVFLVSHASVDDMKNYLTDIKSDRGSIIADSRNKQLIVRDTSAVLVQMEVMISHIDKPERQVMIEARIVEANTNFSRNLGVQWGFNYNDSGASDTPEFNLNSAKAGLGGAFNINPVIGSAGLGSSFMFGALDGDLDINLRLSALENAGEGKIISTPRITTLNGETAVISQGTKIPFTTVSDAGTDVTFENAELKLQVTPEINPDGSIIMDIDVSNSAVGTVVVTAVGDSVSIDEKKAQTKVLVRDGQTTVIGGIFIEDERDADTGVPVLKDVPYLGGLFRSTTKTRDRRELLIFITPRIVTP